MMDRELLLTVRVHGLPCEHVESEKWRHVHHYKVGHGTPDGRCPGGAAAFTLCEACGGQGCTCPADTWLLTSHAMDNDYNFEPCRDAVCPHCVDGLVGHHGFRLTQWCDTHDANWSIHEGVCWVRWGIDNHYMNTPENYDETTPLVDDCVFGWRVTVPVRLGSSDE